MPGPHAMIDLALPDLAATAALGRALAHVLAPGDVVGLSGPLGSGKTALVRFVIAARAARAGAPAPDDVPSPTYTLVQVYDLPDGAIWHFDLYRLAAPDDALELAIEEAFAGAISLIEWPDRLGAHLPADHLDVALARERGDARRAHIAGVGPRGAALEGALGRELDRVAG